MIDENLEAAAGVNVVAHVAASLHVPLELNTRC